MRRNRGPRFPMGAAFAGAAIAAAVIGYFWIGTLIAVGAGWHPLSAAGQRIAAVTSSLQAQR